MAVLFTNLCLCRYFFAFFWHLSEKECCLDIINYLILMNQTSVPQKVHISSFNQICVRLFFLLPNLFFTLRRWMYEKSKKSRNTLEYSIQAQFFQRILKKIVQENSIIIMSGERKWMLKDFSGASHKRINYIFFHFLSNI